MTENDDAEPGKPRKSFNPERFLMKRPEGNLATDKNSNQKTLFKLDWTLGFYRKDKDEYAALRDILLPKIAKVDFDRDRFLNLLSFSFSLSLKEKKRVLSAFSDTGLSEEQIRELMNTFEDEQREFDKIQHRESPHICQLYFRSLDSWARLLWGNFQGCQKLNLILNDLVHSDSKISNQLPRDAHFWKTAADYAVSWKTPFDIFEKIIDNGQSSMDDGDQFSLKVIDFLYKTNLDQLEDRLSYIRQRVSAAQICLEKVLDTDSSSAVIARAWAMGICNDWLLLNEEGNAIKAIENAESAIKKAKNNLKEINSNHFDKIKDTENVVFSWKINVQATFNHSDDEIIRTLDFLQNNQSGEIFSNHAIDALYYKFQFGLASKYLYRNFISLTSEEVPDERLYAFETADSAIELLAISTISGNHDYRLHSTFYLLGFCQKYLLNDPPAPHEIQKWRCIYRATHIIEWIGITEQEDHRHSIEEIRAKLNEITKAKEINLLQSLENKLEPENLSKLRKLSPIHIAVTCLNGLISEDENLGAMWRLAITDRRTLFQTIVILFSLSSNYEIRSHTQSLAHDLLGAIDGGIFGPNLKSNLDMFGKFGSKLSFCGSKNPFKRNPYQWDYQLTE